MGPLSVQGRGNRMQEEMTGWTARPRPVRQTIEGRFVRLEPLDVDRHGRDLYRASNMPDAGQKFRWLPEQPPTAESDFLDWVR
jgi:hypothetical protein